MVYIIFLGIFAFSLVLLIIGFLTGFFENSVIEGILVWTFIVSTIVCVIWSACGGYKYITQPEYNYVLTEEVNIPELDTKKKETGIHDIVYVDSEKCIVYIDSTINEKGRITVYDGDEAHLEIYHCIPKNSSKSVDLGFNRHYEYKVYVPSGYKVVTINLK